MEIKEAIKAIKKQVPNPSQGLPEELFLFVTEITPMVNVDLLIQDEKGRTLLSWRNDDICGQGWHVPGGIIRFKETMIERLKKVAQEEIGTSIKFDPKPITVEEIMITPKTRGHFISFLFRCHVPSTFVPENKGLKEKDAGYLKWHKTCPLNLIRAHRAYIKYIDPSFDEDSLP